MTRDNLYPYGYSKTKIRIRIPFGKKDEIYVHPVLIHEVVKIEADGPRSAIDAKQEVVLKVTHNGYAYKEKKGVNST